MAFVKPPRKPARWTWRLPIEAVWGLTIVVLLATGTVLKRDERCRVCAHERHLRRVSLSIPGKFDVPFAWWHAEAAVTHLQREVFGAEHRHQYAVSGAWSRRSLWSGETGREWNGDGLIAHYFENDPEFRAFVLDQLARGGLTPQRLTELVWHDKALCATRSENWHWRYGRGQHELIEAHFGESFNYGDHVGLWW